MLDDLPADLVSKFLCILPVKEVIRVSSLKQSYYSLIHSKSFVSLYNKQALINGSNPPLLFIRSVDAQGLTKYSLRCDTKSLDEIRPVHFPFIGDCRSYPLVAFCNSLVCLFDLKGNHLILWNPYIQKTLTLPKSSYDIHRDCVFGLGFVDETSDYKVLMINHKHESEIYSLQLNSWTRVTGAPSNIYSHRKHLLPVCVKCSLYWLFTKYDSKTVQEQSVVRVFDLKSEVFSEIRLPEGWESQKSAARLKLMAYKESSIAIVGNGKDLGIPQPHQGSRCFFHIQIMDVNEKKWNKYSVIDSTWNGKTFVLGFNKEGEEIIERKRFRAIAIRRAGRCRNFINHSEIGSGFVCNYINNLALLDEPEPEPEPGESSRQATTTKCANDVQNS